MSRRRVAQALEQSVRATYEAFNRRDLDGVFEAFYDSDFVWQDDPALPGGGEYTGRAGVGRVWARVDELFEHFELEVEDVIEIDEDVILVLVRGHARTRLGGISIDNPAAHLYRVVGGRAVRCRQYVDRSEALAQFGLV